jgi:hypothetical protein
LETNREDKREKNQRQEMKGRKQEESDSIWASPAETGQPLPEKSIFPNLGKAPGPLPLVL